MLQYGVEERDIYRVLVGKPEGKKSLGRPRSRWEDNIKMDLHEVGAQDRDRWRAFVNAVMNFRVFHKMRGISYLNRSRLASQAGFCPI
jgi:hypothetical protein